MELATNKRLELARRIIENTGTSLFLTGKAGTGKTTFLRNLRSTSRKRIVVCAPTGIAAINAGGVTLHSFFQLEFGPFVPGEHSGGRRKFNYGKDKLKIIRGMDLLVIDEVSMVRADLLDAVDDVLRRLRDRTKPFGGVQLLLIGDLQQLAPVMKEEERHLLEGRYKSMFFFDSLALQQLHYETVELDEVFRQRDADFLNLLNAVRENRVDRKMLDRLNSRCIPDFNPGDDEGYIRLTTHNDAANVINDGKLNELPTPEHEFVCHVEGRFPESSYPADQVLRLKVGAQVMFVKNDSGMDRAYYNGMLGQVVAIDDEHGVAVRPQEGGELIHVQPAEWDNISYTVDPETKEIIEHKEGSFTQYPLKLAWAVTIHKSQGLTFEKAVIDVKRSFAHGQTYVALSRCRTLNGLVLKSPVSERSIINDQTVDRFMVEHKCEDMEEDRLKLMERQYKVSMLEDLFNFRQMFAAMEGVVRLYQENFLRRYPAIVQDWVTAYEKNRSEINKVADTFRNQYTHLAMEGSRSDQVLQERVRAACKYFGRQLAPIASLAVQAIRNSDNKSVRNKLQERLGLFEDLLATKIRLLASFSNHDFNTDVYLDLKAQVLLEDVKTKPGRQSKGKKGVGDSRTSVSDSCVGLAVPDMKAAAPERTGKKDEDDGPVGTGNVKVKGKKSDKAEQKVKIPTSKISLDLYRKGNDIGRIAEIRGLTTATVFRHLMDVMNQEELGDYIKKYVDVAQRTRIETYLASTPELPATLTEIRNAIGGEPSWEAIRMIMKYQGRQLTYKPLEADTVSEPTAPYATPSDFIEPEP